MSNIIDDPLKGQIGVDINGGRETHDAFGGKLVILLQKNALVQ